MSKRTSIGVIALVCFLLGIVAGGQMPFVYAQTAKAKDPRCLYGFNLKSRKSDEAEFTDKTKKYAIKERGCRFCIHLLKVTVEFLLVKDWNIVDFPVGQYGTRMITDTFAFIDQKIYGFLNLNIVSTSDDPQRWLGLKASPSR